MKTAAYLSFEHLFEGAVAGRSEVPAGDETGRVVSTQDRRPGTGAPAAVGDLRLEHHVVRVQTEPLAAEERHDGPFGVEQFDLPFRSHDEGNAARRGAIPPSLNGVAVLRGLVLGDVVSSVDESVADAADDARRNISVRYRGESDGPRLLHNSSLDVESFEIFEELLSHSPGSFERFDGHLLFVVQAFKSLAEAKVERGYF